MTSGKKILIILTSMLFFGMIPFARFAHAVDPCYSSALPVAIVRAGTPSYFPSIQAAYSDVSTVSGDIIRVKSGYYAEALSLSGSFVLPGVTISGGHDDCFAQTPSPVTNIDGTMTISGGPVVADGLALVSNTHSLTVTGLPLDTGSGTVTSSLPGINCGAVCSARYPAGTVVTLTAVPDINSHFDWPSNYPACSGSGSGTCTVTINTDIQAVISFTINVYDVFLSVGPGGSTSPSTGQVVQYGNTTWFDITQDPGRQIDQVGGCGGSLAGNRYTTGPITGPCTVSVTFTPTVTVTKNGTGTGKVTMWPGEISCGTNCLDSYPLNSTVHLSPSPEYGSVFAGWTGACSGTGLCILTVDGKKTVTATFNLRPLSANFIASPMSAAVSRNISFRDLSFGAPTSWFWNFGDGATSTQQNPVHSYSAPGSYNVSLTVSDGSTVDTRTITGYMTICGDTSTDPSNCGFCGNVCGTPLYGTAACSMGECGYTCADPENPLCGLIDVGNEQNGALAVASSPTGDGFSLWNALDGDPDNDYTSFTGPLPVYFSIGFGREVRVKAIELTWDSDTNYATAYKIEDTDYLSSFLLTQIYSTSGAAGKTQTVTFGTPQSSSYLRFTVTGMSGTLPLLLRQIKVLAEQPTALETLIYEVPPVSQYEALNSKDPANPLSIDSPRLPFIGKYATVADAVLNGNNTLTSHQKMKELITFMGDYKRGRASSTKPEDTLAEKIGVCGHFARASLPLAASQGIPASIVTLANYPPGNGDTTAEFRWDGKWRLYGPLYGAYYTTEPGNDINPYVLSFDELREGGGQDPSSSLVILNQTRYNAQLPTSATYSSPAMFENAQPGGPIGPDHPVFYPRTLDLITNNTLTAAQYDELTVQGAKYVGINGVNYNQDFTLTGLVPGAPHKLSMTSGGIGWDHTTKPAVFNAYAFSLGSGCVITDGGTYSVTPGAYVNWDVTFIPSNSSCAIRLAHPYMGPDFFYLYVTAYTLTQP
ncbi:MAG: PKD domain-containing protein [Nitrospirae bacterium]|nr:PKD domain-containing protein [Nitrospirota bacterium]